MTTQRKTHNRKREIITLSQKNKATILEVMGDGDEIIEEMIRSGGSFEDNEINQYVLTGLERVDGIKELDDEALLDVPTFDRMYLLKRIRVLTHGNIVLVPWICERRYKGNVCGQKNESEIDLAKLQERWPDYGAQKWDDPQYGEVALRITNGRTENTYAATPNVDRLLVRVESVGGEPFKGSKSYPSRFLKTVRNHRSALDGDPGMAEPCICSRCNQISTKSVICPDFFGL